eukprot:CCRYP_018812-RC/>CCRYP_018812-RC protein AED:0.04 eAED:0.04 QI:429/1/0.75/1/1/1/8/954/926
MGDGDREYSIDEDDGFDNYVQSTVDPGASIFVFTSLFCAASLVALPFLVSLGNRRASERKARKESRELERNEKETIPVLGEKFNRKKMESEEMAPDDNYRDTIENGDELTNGDELSIFSILEKDMCDDKSTQCDDSDSYCFDVNHTNDLMSDILQTPFCCVGPDMMAVELPPLPPNRDKKRKRNESFHNSSPSSTNYLTSAATKRSSVFNSSEHSDSRSIKVSPHKHSRREILRKALKSMTRSFPVTPELSPRKVPKTTPLDGGFFGQRKHRNHGIINEKQIKREETCDRLRKEMQICCNCFDDPLAIEVEIIDENNSRTSNNIANALERTNASDDPSVSSKTDQSRCCGLLHAAHSASNIFRWDSELQRIIALMLPFTVTSILSKIFEGINIALISWRLGTESLAAYAVADYIVELTFQSLRGFTDAQSTLCSHAIGAGNYHLTGQYVQLSVIAFVFFGIFLAFSIDKFTYDVLVWLDMSSDIATIGQQWASIAAIAAVFNGVNEALFQFMNTIDTDILSNIILTLMSAANTFALAITFLNEGTTLVHVALIKLGTVILFIMINIIFMAWKGWLSLCWSGLVESFSLKVRVLVFPLSLYDIVLMVRTLLKNPVAVKHILKTGIPLSLGSIAREIEGGVLVIFSSSMGPAEVATFTIVRTVWDVFAACMEGICCAGEIRCAYFIGTGNISMARISSYKSLMVGTMFGILLTYGFYELFEDQVNLVTRDVTLQVWKLRFSINCVKEDTPTDKFILSFPTLLLKEMMLELVPLICIGNLTMSTGMLCWSLLGAQGRFRLATLITFLSGWFVTIPLAALFVYGLHINLQGIVASVTIGYSVSGTALMYLLLRSNWSKRVEKVQRSTVNEYNIGHNEPIEVLVCDEAASIESMNHFQSCRNDERCVQRVNADENSTLPCTEKLRKYYFTN